MSLLISYQSIGVTASTCRDIADIISLTTTHPRTYLLLVQNLHGVKALGRLVLDEHHASKRAGTERSYSIKLVESGIVLQLSSIRHHHRRQRHRHRHHLSVLNCTIVLHVSIAQLCTA